MAGSLSFLCLTGAHEPVLVTPQHLSAWLCVLRADSEPCRQRAETRGPLWREQVSRGPSASVLLPRRVCSLSVFSAGLQTRSRL